MRRAVMLFALAVAGCAASNNVGGGVAGPAVESARPRQVIAAVETAPADSSSNYVGFRMPTHYALPNSYRPDPDRPLPPRYYRWRLGISTQSRVWRDSTEINGPAWGQDLGNMAKWLPGAQVYPLCEGWAWVGDSVRVRLPLVASIGLPATIWASSCSDSCQQHWAKVGRITSN